MGPPLSWRSSLPLSTVSESLQGIRTYDGRLEKSRSERRLSERLGHHIVGAGSKGAASRVRALIAPLRARNAKARKPLAQSTGLRPRKPFTACSGRQAASLSIAERRHRRSERLYREYAKFHGRSYGLVGWATVDPSLWGQCNDLQPMNLSPGPSGPRLEGLRESGEETCYRATQL